MNKQVVKKTLQDLEFYTVLEQVTAFCSSDLGKEAVLNIQPIATMNSLFFELNMVNEYLSSLVSENRIPNHSFDNLTTQIKRLAIEHSFLETDAFLKVATTATTVNGLKKFFQKFETYYPTLTKLSAEIEYTTFVSEAIMQKITPYGEVLNHASPALKRIRKNINYVRGQISESFSRALSKHSTNGYLDDIRETIIGNQRVLAVLAMHRRKVAGSLLGSSKSGNIVYIAPQATLAFSRELQDLRYEEQQEIIKILRALAEEIRPYVPLLQQYLRFLTHLDVIGAKAKYAQEIQAILPKIHAKRTVFFKDAYHPILWRKNKATALKTVSQTIALNDQQQIIVISGPNAGGKSITLKTVGLLQLMLQSGLLIPVHERSETTFFDTILTDIGDNQSIENQLSTYSYRLKNMRYFLRKCTEHTLFLIDEFGTGSDPELGGALAEIFLEEFYQKKAFGIITTHYANLKVLANELAHVTNANMQFNAHTLAPTYKLLVGQAGSSFTFEVAQKNGIPFRIINRAKKRVEREKVRLDHTISKLQKERSKLQKTSDTLEKQLSKEQEQLKNLQQKEQKIKQKLEGFQELYDHNQRMLSLGRAIHELLHTYFQTNNKKKFTAHFFKWVATEKTKFIKKNPPKKTTKVEKKQQQLANKKQAEILKKVEQEVLKKVVKVRQEKKIAAEKIAKTKAIYTFNVGDRVRLADGNAVGTIDKIEKKKAFISYGFFTTETNIEQLELVQKAK